MSDTPKIPCVRWFILGAVSAALLLTLARHADDWLLLFLAFSFQP